jgi:hypothetical protein
MPKCPKSGLSPYHIGWDLFTPPPGEAERMDCRVCGAGMDAARGLTGPTGFAEAMARRGHLHDRFTCPNSGEPWHREALALRQAMEDTPSRRVRALMGEDLDELLAAHAASRRNTIECVEGPDGRNTSENHKEAG